MMLPTVGAGRRTRWLAKQTGVHLPYLDLLPASETVRYADAAIAMFVSVLFTGAGWMLVGSLAVAGGSVSVRLVGAGIGGGAAAGVVWVIDRELISGEGRLEIRSMVGAMNALFVGELVVLALFAPYVNRAVVETRARDYATAVAAALRDYDAAIAVINAEQAAAVPVRPDALVAADDEVSDAVSQVGEAEVRLAELVELRTAEVAGRVVVGDDGQALTSGQAGDQGLATESLDQEIGAADETLVRAVERLDDARRRRDDLEADHLADLDSTRGNTTRFDRDRQGAVEIRDAAVAAADAVRDAPGGLLERIHVFHASAWSDPVLVSAVVVVHLAIFAAEMSVVLWAVKDRRRPVRLYPQLVAEIDAASTSTLSDLAHALTAPLPSPLRSSESGSRPTPPMDTPADRSPIAMAVSAVEAVDLDHDLTRSAASEAVGFGGGPSVDSAVRARLTEIMHPRPIEVAVLRARPSVSGLVEALPPKPVAVLAFLAFHREVPLGDLRSLFWPTSSSPSASSNTLWAIKKALGTDEAGQARLVNRNNLITIGADVGSDWDRLNALGALVDELDAASPEDRLAVGVAALDLVDGTPASRAAGDPGNWSWLTGDPATRNALTAAVRTTADWVIDLAHITGAPHMVAWVVSQARHVGPFDPPAAATQARLDGDDSEHTAVEASGPVDHHPALARAVVATTR